MIPSKLKLRSRLRQSVQNAELRKNVVIVVEQWLRDLSEQSEKDGAEVAAEIYETTADHLAEKLV